jgi:phage/plasmid-like protein (TIGR03299 family)
MAYIGEKPWHGLGQALTPGQTIKTWAREAGIDYRICRSRVRFGDAADPQIWDERHVFFRSDTKKPLGIGSDGFQLVQPAEVLGFFRDLCAEHGFTLETAGTLYDGAKFWALARLPLDFTLPGRDQVSGYALLATSCDGSLATTGQITSVRVVCDNTLRMATASGKDAIKVRHSSVFNETKVKVDMGLLQGQWQAFADNARKLAARKITRAEAVKILVDAIGDPEKKIEDQPNARPMGQILELFDGAARGSELDSAKGTAWGLVNAATEFADHYAGRSTNSRLNSAWFGTGAARKAAIFEKALVMADGTIEHRPFTGAELLDTVLDQPVNDQPY